MGVDYIQNRECPVKRGLGLDTLLARIKARGHAELLARRLRESGEDPATATVTRVVQYPSGPVMEEVSVAQLMEAGRSLKGYEHHCRDCTANFLEWPFGCCGYLNYPLAAAEEQWLLSRLPKRSTCTAGVYLRNVFRQLAIDGAPVAAMRKAGPLYCENREAPRHVWAEGAGEVSADELLHFTFFTGAIGPSHAALLCLFLGLLPHDLDPEIVQAILKDPPRLQDHLTIDAGLLAVLRETQMGMFLMGMMSAAINGEELLIDA